MSENKASTIPPEQELNSPTIVTLPQNDQIQDPGVEGNDGYNNTFKENAEPDAPVQNIFDQGGKSYRTLTLWDTTFVLLTNQIGLGVLSLPGCLRVLGVVPGVIAILV